MQVGVLTLSKSGLSTASIFQMTLMELGSWINSASMLATGKRPIDPDIKRDMAVKNSAALKELMKRKKS